MLAKMLSKLQEVYVFLVDWWGPMEQTGIWVNGVSGAKTKKQEV